MGAWLRWAYDTARLWFTDRAMFWRQMARLATARRAHVELRRTIVANGESPPEPWYHPTLEMIVADEWLLYDAASKACDEGKSLYVLAATDTVYVLPKATGNPQTDGGQLYPGTFTEKERAQALAEFARVEAERAVALEEVQSAISDLSRGRRLCGD